MICYLNVCKQKSTDIFTEVISMELLQIFFLNQEENKSLLIC